MRRFSPWIALGFASLTVSCADNEINPFDPDSDRTPPSLTNFEIVNQGQAVYALWSASEPVKPVVSYVEVGVSEPRYSYPAERGFSEAGMIELVGIASDTDHRLLDVRLTDRAGNETSDERGAPPTPFLFNSGPVADEPLFRAVMIDVGWGDALYLEAPDGTNVLIDAGHPEDGERVHAFFARQGITELDFASLSHVHNDHIGGFYGEDFPDQFDGLIVNNVTTTPIRIGTFLDIADKTTINNPYGDLVAALGAAMSGNRLDEWVLLEAGANSDTHEVLRWGDGVRVDLLAAGRKDFLLPDFILADQEGSVINNDSMVYRVQFGNFVIILTGDAEFTTEQYLQNNYTSNFLRATVLKLGHHGSNDSNSERFIRFVSPVVALITNAVSENPGVEHPFVLSRLRNLGVDYFASDRAFPNRDRALPGVRADVQILTDGNGFTVLTDNLRFE